MIDAAEQVLGEALAHGVRLYLKDDRLAYRAASAVAPELLARLTEHKPAILDYLRQQERLRGASVLPGIEVRRGGGSLPLSYAQQRLWFIERLEGGTAQYNIPSVMRVSGELNLAALERALETIVARHESLRTVFREVEGEVRQVILDPPRMAIETIEPGRIAEEALRPFDLSGELPLRVRRAELGEDEQLLLLTLHHIASDGWSMGVLRDELTALYGAFTAGEPDPLPPLRIQYADYAQWQRQWLEGEVLESQLRYWRERLAGVPGVHELPLDRPRKPMPSIEGGRHLQRLAPALRAKIEGACREHGVTLFMFLESAFAVLLSRMSQQSDIVVGSPIAGRVHQELEPLIGFFVNTLVLRSRIGRTGTFRALLAESKQTILEAYAHQHVPFEMLVEDLRPERSLSHTPLFQILFAVQHADARQPRLGKARVTPYEVGGSGTIVKFELELTAIEDPEELQLYWAYRRDLFDAATIERLARHFEVLLEAVVGHPDQAIGTLPLLEPREREELLERWSMTAPAADSKRCLHELLFERAAMQPGAVAIIDGTVEITYGQLATAARGVAHRLHGMGVGPESVVGVCLERSWQMVATLLGVMSAGAAYLPLDPLHPPARLEQVLGASGAAVVVGHEPLVARLPWNGPTLVLSEEVFADAEPVASGVGPNNLAYVLFTSGSTGTPKGVAITHASATELMAWGRGIYSDQELAGVLAATSLSFDLSVFEIFVPLAYGGTVIVAENALALPSLPARERVRLVNTVPSAMAELVRAGSVPPTVRTVNLAGEPLPRALADQLFATGTVEALWNLYGPSEATTYSTFAPVAANASEPPSIGRPIAGTRAYVVDEGGEPVPIGVAGELWLAGAGLARGYLHRADLTAERFTADPFSRDPGARVYRTGDRVRWRADGTIEFLGRRDHQVKVRGFRIELGEIESVLRTHPAVRDVVVVARETTLVAYVVADAEPAELREHLRARLPQYMLPIVVLLHTLPLTPNGKVDRAALPSPEGRDPVAEHVPPRDVLDLRLARIWGEVLQREAVGIRDDFFLSGGHSLLALRLMARVEKQLGVRLPLATLFQAPTIETFAAHLRRGGSREWSPLVPVRGGDAAVPPLFFVHPIGGDVLCYAALAQRMPANRPIYALQAAGVDGSRVPLDDVEAMASTYLERIRAVQPRGPYLLGGWSFGGLVAFEMARQLVGDGELVAQLVLIDSAPPGHAAYREATPLSFAFDFAARAGIELPPQRGDAAELPAEELLAALVDEARRRDILPADAPASAIESLFGVYLANGRAGSHYSPAASPQRAVLLQASARRAPQSPDFESSWRRLLGSDLEVVYVPGDHYSVLRPPHVERVAAELEARFAAAQGAMV